MNRKWNRAKHLWAAVLLAALTGIVGAGAGWAAPGVTDNEILIGRTADLSGPIAFMGTGGQTGAELYLRELNDKGGVHGRRVRFIVEDDGFQAPRAVQGARKLVTRDGVFAMYMVLGATQANAMYPMLESHGVPLVFPGTQARDMAIPPRKYLFLADTTNTTYGKVAIEYFVEEMGMKDPVLACIYQDDSNGHDWLRGVNIAARHYGFDVLELSYRRGAVDFSSQVALAKQAGVTHVMLYGVIREPAMVLREAQRQQFRAIFICSYSSMNNTTLQLAGDAVNYSHGLYGFGTVYDFENDRSPGMVEYMEAAKKYGLDNWKDFMPCYGYLNTKMFVEALKRAGRNLTREGLITALESFDDYTPGVRPPVTFGPDLRDGCRAVGLGKAVDGAWRSLLPEGEWIYSTIDEY